MLKLLMALGFATAMTCTAANAADWQFAGTWRLNVTCKQFKMVNTLRIKEANKTKVLGSTNVGEGWGRIVGGSFDGSKVTFTNKYNMNGRNYTETWTGTLSRNGSYLKGAFTTTNTADGGCSFEGPRR